MDDKRTVGVRWHIPALTSPLQLATGSATAWTDLSDYVTRCTQSPKSAEIELDLSFTGNIPQPGDLIEIMLDGAQLWWGVIESQDDYRRERGTSRVRLQCRARDASPHWRRRKRTTDAYTVGTEVYRIAADALALAGVTPAEIVLPSAGPHTVHSTVQLADMPLWEMLESLLRPQGLEPFVDAHGLFRPYSRDVARAADLTIGTERIIRVSGSKGQVPASIVRIKWLDPNLQFAYQQDQPLITASLTAGFFQSSVDRQVAWGADQTQRAQNTYMSIRQTANSGLFNVCDEGYTELSPTSGKITLKSNAYTQALAVGLMAAIFATSNIPDGVVAFGGGSTIPIGKPLNALATIALLQVMASIGTGTYEIRGQPYDWSFSRNVTEAVSATADGYSDNIIELETDFTENEAEAQAYAVRELIYEARSASSWSFDAVDDTRLEPGDIATLGTGEKFYITDLSRELSRGSQSIVQVKGFRV
jgi:hypothetical protein